VLELNAWVRPNEKDIAVKVLDGEAIMINLTNGTYYSLDKMGTEIWELIVRGEPLAQVLQAITQKYAVNSDTAKGDFKQLVGELLDEGLVLEGEGEATRSIAPLQAESTSTRLPYASPEFSVYRDMSDLLDLEPPTPGAAQEDLW